MFDQSNNQSSLPKDQPSLHNRVDQASHVRRVCEATKRNGRPCRAWAIPDSDPPRCVAHRPPAGQALNAAPDAFVDAPPRRCTAMTAAGHPCLGWAVRSSDPPLCPAHGGGRRGPGAPQGNGNAWVHGYYATTDRALDTIDDIIADLAEKQVFLSGFIDDALTDPYVQTTVDRLIRVFDLHGQNASRLGRLFRDRKVLQGHCNDGLSAAIAEALAEIESELEAEHSTDS